MNAVNGDVLFQTIEAPYCRGCIGGLELIFNQKENMFNATKLTHQEGKRFRHWLGNQHTKTLIMCFPPYSDKDTFEGKKEKIFKNHSGGSTDTDKLLQGTYIPQELLLNLANWISPECFIKTAKIVQSYNINELADKNKKDNEKFNSQLENLTQKNNELTTQIEQIANQNQCKDEELEHVKEQIKRKDEELEFKNMEVEYIQKTNAYLEKKKTHLEKTVTEMGKNYVQKLNNPLKRHVFGIVEKGIDDRSFTSIRTQKRSYAGALKRKRKQFPDAETVYYLKHHPNSISFFNRIKQEFPNVVTRYNDIYLPESYSIEEFIRDVDTEDQKPPRTRSESSSSSEDEYYYSDSSSD